MATVNAAEFLGTTATAGSVEAGKNADLVLLRNNPVDDVTHMSSLVGVVRGGRLHTGAELTAIKANVSRHAPAH